jgi:hypothetical protein
MSKAKTALKSKNNPNARGSGTKFFAQGKEIKPVKLITETSTYFAAEFEDGQLVLNQDGHPVPWRVARNLQ